MSAHALIINARIHTLLNTGDLLQQRPTVSAVCNGNDNETQQFHDKLWVPMIVFPALFDAADRKAVDAQRDLLTATQVRLAGLLGAAFFGLFTWKIDAIPGDWAGIVAAISFGIALLAEIFILRNEPARVWYDARAAAESVKTLTWRYAVGGNPFPRSLADRAADALFLQQLRSILGVVRNLNLDLPAEVAQISPWMRDLRQQTLADRRAIYVRDRVQDQQAWYARKAQWNSVRASRWTMGMIVAEFGGLAAAILKAVGIVENDLLGLAGAVVAVMLAWLETRQHRSLAAAYSVAAYELRMLREEMPSEQAEHEWAAFVADSEEAFSREHTLWKSTRGAGAT
jgi:protein-S-isoprenylcysteine O-methyltransferase Ste14